MHLPTHHVVPVVVLFGAAVFDCGTMAEMTPFMRAAGTKGSGSGMVLFQDMVYHEVCDPVAVSRVAWG